MYHRVLNEKPDEYDHWHYVTTAAFKKQMELIDKFGFTPITFTDYQLYLENKLTLPSRPIIITFDDGYLDTFKNALPILSGMGMKAVIFVMGNRALRRAEWDEQDESDICPLMTDEQIRQAKEMDFEIGSHSLNHYELSTLPEHEIVYSVTKSKKEIESVLEEPIYTFSYPYGKLDERVENIVSDSGFLFACGVYTGSPKFGETMMDFRRIAINQHTGQINFLLKLLTPYQYVDWLYHIIKTRSKKNEVKPSVMKESVKKRQNGVENYSIKKTKNTSKSSTR